MGFILEGVEQDPTNFRRGEVVFDDLAIDDSAFHINDDSSENRTVYRSAPSTGLTSTVGCTIVASVKVVSTTGAYLISPVLGLVFRWAVDRALAWMAGPFVRISRLTHNFATVGLAWAFVRR